MTFFNKTKLILSLFATAALTFTACSDDDDNNAPIIDPVEPVSPTTNISNEGYYKGDIYGNETGNLWVNFMTEGLTWDDFEEDYTGTGAIVCLDFNTDLASNPDFATLSNGEYHAAATHALHTLNIDGDSYVTTYDANGSAQHEVTGGKVTVSTKDGYTIVKAELILDNDTEYNFDYAGKLKIINRTNEGFMSNLTSDMTIGSLTQGVIQYFGYTFTETSDYCAVTLAGADYNLDENFGNAPAIMLGLNVTPGSAGIPSGTYTLIDAMEADDYDVNTALSGVYEPSLGGFFGTWFFHSLEGYEAALQTGEVSVVNNGNSTYKITFNLKDGYGHSISGTYSGSLSFEDYSD